MKSFRNISMYLFFAVHLPEDGHMSAPNTFIIYFSYTYVHLLVLISHLIAQYTVMDHLK